MRIGVYVGSFDPVHKGHIKVVNYLLTNHYIDKCIIVPTLGYWNKNKQIDIKDRINMLKYYENDSIIIDTTNNKLEYSYQILNSIQNEYKSDELYLIIGNDLISSFDKWKNVDDILKYKIIVIQRLNINTRSYVKKLKGSGIFIVVDRFRNLHLSSTIIRESFYKETKEKMLKMIDSDIYNYIVENKLYK